MKKLVLLFALTSSFCFSQDSLHVKKPKLSVIELERIKVVYRGIDNPIAIAVPTNVKSFTVSGNGVKSTNEAGKYIIKPGVGIETVVKVEMVLQDNSVVVEEHKYQIKGISAPIGTLNNHYATKGYLEFTKTELKDAIVGIKMVDFIYKINYSTTSFDLFSGNKKIFIEGNKINNEAFLFISKLKKNSFLTIDSIQYPNPNDVCRQAINPILIKIID